VTATVFDVENLAIEYDQKDPNEIVKLAFDSFENLAISFSGAEDVVLVDMAVKINPDANIFSIDTGRLHPETYRFLELVCKHYDIKLEFLSPDAETVQQLVYEKGLYSFYKDGHKECCAVRKVVPLRRKLATLDAWITGQRKDQSPDTRAAVPVIENDAAFSTPDSRLIKFNPLSNWTSSQIWKYIRQYNVPFNELHNHGFVSIGCEPCTRPVLPNQHEREGRWWWEESTKKECGLHSGNANNWTI
jgi:phosphoadenosine phosphosulfate reductase